MNFKSFRLNIILITCIFFYSNISYSQTIGTLLNTPEAHNGYTLFIGSGDNMYLVNNCGELINWWNGTFNTGACCYLSEEGNLVRAVRTGENSGFNGGGIGGGVEIRDWDDNVLWQYDYAETGSHHQHHDIEILPNGNILILAWEYRTAAEALQKGKTTVGNSIWPTQVVEVEPVGETEGNIVWYWSMWDHLVQDVYSGMDNYGVISENRQLLDINVSISAQGSADWLHCNSIDYVPEYDLIILSSKNLSEMFVIDHSTTTAEAASHSGGTYGKGGDLLYRWGNPQNYDLGTSDDRIFFGQHDVSWIPTDNPFGGGQFMAFNNDGNGNSATLDAWLPPMGVDGTFNFIPGVAYGPSSPTWRHFSNITANTGCSSRRLPNGNTLECDSQSGRMKEFTIDFDLVWEYKNPVGNGGIQQQGSTSNNPSFRAERYSPDYPGLIGKDLTPQGVIELNSNNYGCIIYEDFVAPNAFFNIDSSELGTVYFSDISTGTDIVSYSWDFGDAYGSSDLENPNYTYTETGSYNVCLTVTNSNGDSSTFCQDVIVSVISSLNEFENTFKIYPNPTNGILYIDHGQAINYKITLYNISGKIILNLSDQNELNLSHLEAGIYTLKIATPEGETYHKVILN